MGRRLEAALERSVRVVMRDPSEAEARGLAPFLPRLALPARARRESGGGGAGRGLEASLDSLPCSVSAWGHGHVGGPRLRSRATRSRSRGYGAAPPPRYPSHLRGGNIKGTSSAPCLIDIAPGDPAWVVPMMRAGHLWELHAPSKRREWASCTASITRCSSSIICCSGLACPFCCLLRATPWSEEKDEAALSTA